MNVYSWLSGHILVSQAVRDSYCRIFQLDFIRALGRACEKTLNQHDFVNNVPKMCDEPLKNRTCPAGRCSFINSTTLNRCLVDVFVLVINILILLCKILDI